jgi:hypothetical protein
LHLHYKVQPIDVYCENRTEHKEYSVDKRQTFLMLKQVCSGGGGGGGGGSSSSSGL